MPMAMRKSPDSTVYCSIVPDTIQDHEKELFMTAENLKPLCQTWLTMLCQDIPGRSVGSTGNRAATRFFDRVLSGLDWKTESQTFEAMDWEEHGAILRCGGDDFRVYASPYSNGYTGYGELVIASDLETLEQADLPGKILLLHGGLAREQLMPKNFIFYNPDHHRQIIARLEKGNPAAILCATSRNAALAGGVYPFPLIEDGDFDIPSVYMTEEEGKRLLGHGGERFFLDSRCRRIASSGENIIARKGSDDQDRIVITAHIDAKKGTPGAIDNATGVVILLLLGTMLAGYEGKTMIELVAFNGEDYYAIPGQMRYIRSMQDHFRSICLNINIDGAGYKQGRSSISSFGVPAGIEDQIDLLLKEYPGLVRGAPWPQGDHSIFVHYGRPAIAVSSEWFVAHIDDQEITHTPKDNLDIVDCARVVETAQALSSFIYRLAR